jgi:hypothetical protein
LDQEDSSDSSIADETKAESKGKKKFKFDYDKYRPEAQDERELGPQSDEGVQSSRTMDPGPSRSGPVRNTIEPIENYQNAKIRPARKEIVAYFESVGGNDDVTADFQRTSGYKFIYPRRFEDRTSRSRMESDPDHMADFEWVQDAIYDLARESLSRRNRFDKAVRDDSRDEEWARFEQKVLSAWDVLHFKRWGDRDGWNRPETCAVGHILPRFFATADHLRELEIRYFSEFGTDLECITPFQGRYRPGAYPLAFNPFIRLHVRTKDRKLYWVHPNENTEQRNFFLDNPQHRAFYEFGKIQSRNHPLHRAVLVRVDNIGEIFAGLFRFLAYYRIDFASGEGVLFRQDARILWSQTSEAWKEPNPVIFRPPTLIFRIGFFHYAWWESRLGSDNVQGTARMYCLEADRWVGRFGAVGNSLSADTDLTKRNPSKKYQR